MVTLLLTNDSNGTVTVGESALYALLGFFVVFVGILLLIAVVWLTGKVMTSAEIKKKKVSVIVPQDTPVNVAENEINEETVAVIMAALTAYYQTNDAKCEFTVKRIKRI